MENWKGALLAGSATISALMFLKGNKTAGMVLAGVSLATLASEYPEEFAELRRKLPDYFERGTAFLDVATRVGERLADTNGRGWYEALLHT